MGMTGFDLVRSGRNHAAEDSDLLLCREHSKLHEFYTINCMDKPKFIQRECKIHGMTEYAFEPGSGKYGNYRCKICRSMNVTNRRKRIKTELVNLRGGGCEVCGYDRCLRSLHFHHRDPSLKKFEIASSGASYKKCEKEAEKCILLCSNCHWEVEDGLISVE